MYEENHYAMIKIRYDLIFTKPSSHKCTHPHPVYGTICATQTISTILISFSHYKGKNERYKIEKKERKNNA